MYTDEYVIYYKLVAWSYGHKSVCYGAGEYAREEDGEDFYEVHVRFLVIIVIVFGAASRYT